MSATLSLAGLLLHTALSKAFASKLHAEPWAGVASAEKHSGPVGPKGLSPPQSAVCVSPVIPEPGCFLPTCYCNSSFQVALGPAVPGADPVEDLVCRTTGVAVVPWAGYWWCRIGDVMRIRVGSLAEPQEPYASCLSLRSLVAIHPHRGCLQISFNPCLPLIYLPSMGRFSGSFESIFLLLHQQKDSSAATLSVPLPGNHAFSFSRRRIDFMLLIFMFW